MDTQSRISSLWNLWNAKLKRVKNSRTKRSPQGGRSGTFVPGMETPSGSTRSASWACEMDRQRDSMKKSEDAEGQDLAGPG